MYAPHQPLAGGQVLYIGRAAPTMTMHGIDAIQKPLGELYSKSDRQSRVQDQESLATVLTSGIFIKPINELDKDTWHRIQDLDSCAAVKAYNDPAQCGRLVFVPNDSVEARSSSHPTIFAVVMKRSSGIAISDCYAYLCPSDSAASTLVQACKQAHSNTCGWANERPSDAQLGLQKPKVIDTECYVDDHRDDCAPEFYEKPSLSGFFYAPRSDLIQKYNISNEDDEFAAFQRCQDQRPIEHFTCPGPSPSQPAPQLPAIQFEHVETCPANPVGCQHAYQPQPQPMMVPIDYNQQMMCSDYGQQMLANQQQQQQMLAIQQQQQYMISCQAPNPYIQGVDVPSQGYLTKEQIKAQKKAEKKHRKEEKNYCPSEGSDGGYRQPLREFTGNGGVTGPPSQTGSGGNLYMTSLQQPGQPGDIIPVKMTQQDRLIGNVPNGYALGMGDLGPPQGGNYYVKGGVPQQQPAGMVEDEMALYSRRLPQGADCTVLPPGARDFDGNFILRQHEDYKFVAGGAGQMRGRSYGVIASGDQY